MNRVSNLDPKKIVILASSLFLFAVGCSKKDVGSVDNVEPDFSNEVTKGQMDQVIDFNRIFGEAHTKLNELITTVEQVKNKVVKVEDAYPTDIIARGLVDKIIQKCEIQHITDAKEALTISGKECPLNAYLEASIAGDIAYQPDSDPERQSQKIVIYDEVMIKMIGVKEFNQEIEVKEIISDSEQSKKVKSTSSIVTAADRSWKMQIEASDSLAKNSDKADFKEANEVIKIVSQDLAIKLEHKTIRTFDSKPSQETFSVNGKSYKANEIDYDDMTAELVAVLY